MLQANEGWTLRDQNFDLPSDIRLEDCEKVVDVGGNTVVKIWTVVEDVPTKTDLKSVELIVRHDENGVTHQIYFRVLLGGNEPHWNGVGDVPFMRVHSCDGVKIDRNIIVGQQEGETRGVMENVYASSNIDVKPRYCD